jgi:hypothetical protein
MSDKKNRMLRSVLSFITQRLFEKTWLRRSVMFIAMEVFYLPSPIRGDM